MSDFTYLFMYLVSNNNVMRYDTIR